MEKNPKLVPKSLAGICGPWCGHHRNKKNCSLELLQLIYLLLYLFWSELHRARARGTKIQQVFHLRTKTATMFNGNKNPQLIYCKINKNAVHRSLRVISWLSTAPMLSYYYWCMILQLGSNHVYTTVSHRRDSIISVGYYVITQLCKVWITKIQTFKKKYEEDLVFSVKL